MKICRMLAIVVLWCHSSAASCIAQEFSHKIPDVTSVATADFEPKTKAARPKPKASAAYKIALGREKQLENELNALQRLDYAATDVTFHAAMLTASLKAAEQAVTKRAASRATLPEKAETASVRRKAAVAAISAYRAIADEALSAIFAFAHSDKNSAATNASLADTAVNKKIEARRKAETAVSVAVDAGKEFRNLIASILASDDDVKESLAKARDHGEEIIILCNSQAGYVTSENAELAIAMNTSLADVRTRVEAFNIRSQKAVSAETEAYQHLHATLQGIRDREVKGDTIVEDYFATSVTAVVASEAHSYASSLWGSNTVDASFRTELDTAAESLKTARAEADNALAAFKKSIKAASDSVGKLTKNSEQIPANNEGLASLIEESSTLLSGFSEFEEKIQAAVIAKRAELMTARHAADKAYLFAFSQPRHEKAVKSAKPPEKMAMAAKNQPLQEHVYTHVSALKHEPPGYGAYTYVLFSHNQITAPEHIKKRYDALLQAIYNSTSSIQNFTADIPKDKLNLFCIPHRKNSTDKKTDGEYDPDLARSYLATAGSGALLREEIISRIRISPGPFLLTTRTRLSDGSSKSQLLFVDLSSYASEAYDSILAEYKNTLVVKPPTGQVLWTPPATQRIVYAGISASNAIPGLVDNLKKILDFFIPSAEASTGSK